MILDSIENLSQSYQYEFSLSRDTWPSPSHRYTDIFAMICVYIYTYIHIDLCACKSPHIHRAKHNANVDQFLLCVCRWINVSVFLDRQICSVHLFYPTAINNIHPWIDWRRQRRRRRRRPSIRSMKNRKRSNNWNRSSKNYNCDMTERSANYWNAWECCIKICSTAKRKWLIWFINISSRRR